MTHVAAIGVGVLIALFFGGVFNKNEKASADNAAPATANGAAKKKKKKNKKKAKVAPEPAASAPSPPALVKEAPVKEAPVKETPQEAPKEETPAAPAPTNGGKKKKKKKKNGAQNPVATNGSANGSANNNNTKAPAPAPTPAAPAFTPLQPRIVVEEAWETIPKKTKKKKGVKKPQVAVADTSKIPAPAETKVTTSVSIDASRVGIIIGPKGATMNAIQEKTGTKLDVNAPKPDEKTSGGSNQFRPVVGGKNKAKATVVISEGSTEGQKAAKKAILELADRGYATLLQAEGFGESSVSVHPRFLSEIVGPGGKIIKAIQSELDVKLTIPKTDWTPKTVQVRSILL